jgi:predicted DNA-binding transcriptional regulator AlpA
MPSAPAQPDLAPLLVDIVALSKLLQRSVASLHRDDVEGRLPAGLQLGGSKRWRYAEIVAWVEAGAPERRKWEAIKAPVS